MKIEAIFGGVLALFVVAVAAKALLDLPAAKPKPLPPYAGLPSIVEPVLSSEQELVCFCFDNARSLARRDVGVMSSEYRQGFSTCRAYGRQINLAERASNAWTDGWNAALSARPYEASCRSYLRRGRA